MTADPDFKKIDFNESALGGNPGERTADPSLQSVQLALIVTGIQSACAILHILPVVALQCTHVRVHYHYHYVAMQQVMQLTTLKQKIVS